MNYYINDLKAIEKQYAELVNSFDFSSPGVSFYYQAIGLIEKCEMFWTSNRPKISRILDDLTSNSHCFVLAGAIFLDTNNSSHYEFAALGEYHLLNDPFVRMRNFFANGESSVTEQLKEYFLDAFSDTITILNDYSNYFSFISLDVLCVPRFDEYILLGNKAYWDLISDALNKDYRSLNDLKRDFHTLDEIEKAMRPELNKHFIFSDENDANLSLKERIEKYCEYNQSLISMDLQDDIERFYISTMGQIQQAIDITFKCAQYNLHPFIRFEVTFHYLLLLLGCFPKEKYVESLLLDVIISYLFSNYVIGNEIEKVAFDDYISFCSKEKLFDKMCGIVNANSNNAFSMSLAETVEKMSEEYHKVF